MIAIFSGDETDTQACNTRPRDLAAFNKLHSLGVVTGRYVISSAEHNVIYLGVDCDKLACAATKQDILELMGLGVCYDSEYGSLFMFV